MRRRLWRAGIGIVPLCLALQATADQAAPTPAPPSCVQERDLLTPAEVAEHRAKMASLQTDAERAAFRRENHEEMRRRAAARGTVLCDERSGGPKTGTASPSRASDNPPPSK
ncbi:MAG TPA: hypothetical protein DEP35_08660 [Deltaproteobacteria bacterium]|nr:hypothetical protein [Deltaproteobacteria bacterium]